MVFTHLLAVAALSLSTSATVYQGFNYGATQTDGSVKQQSDFQSEFQTAKGLAGASGFTSARLYTMIQGGTTSDPTAAIPAAIAEDTTLLLGLWASAGETVVNNEIAALKSAIDKYGSKFTDRVVGISVGSEDLYRDSQMGIDSHAGIGTGPDTIISYVKQVRSAISGTTLSKAPIGHVDTWTAWTNGSIASVVDAVDWLGVDAYPYFQNTMANSISDAQGLFNDALGATQGAAKGKPVWITETGYPLSGSKSNLAVPSLENAKTYWDEVGCALFGKTNTWWYTLQDADPTTPDPSFGIVGGKLSTTPLFNLTCPSGSKSVLTGAAATSSASSSSSTTTGKGSSSNGTSTTAGSTSSPSTGSGSSASSGSSSGSSSSTGSSSGPTVAPSSGGSNTTSTGSSSGSSTGASNGTSTGSGSGSSTGSGSSGSPSGSASGSASGPLHTGAATANSGSIVTVMGAIAAFLAFF